MIGKLSVDVFFGVFSQKLFTFLLTVDTTKELFNFDFARKLHDSINHSFGSRRTSGQEDVDRHDVFDAFGNVI